MREICEGYSSMILTHLFKNRLISGPVTALSLLKTPTYNGHVMGTDATKDQDHCLDSGSKAGTKDGGSEV